MTGSAGEVTADVGGVGLLAAVTSANFAQFGARVVISPFVLVIVGVFGVSKGQVGAALTGLWAAFALMQFPGGVLADRYGEKQVILASMGLTTIGSVLVAMAPTFPIFVLAVILLGLGSGLYFAVGTALLARRMRRRGRAFGIHSAGGPLAGIVLPVVATAIALRTDWRAGVAVGGIVAAIAFVLVIRMVDAPPGAAPGISLRSRFSLGRIRTTLFRPGVLFSTVLAVLGMYTFQAFVSFFPTFLQEYHGFSEAAASLAFGLAFALATIGLPIVGTFADIYGIPAGLVIPFTLTGAGFLALLGITGSTGMVYGGVCIVGIGLTWAGPLQSRFMHQFGAEERASGFGLARTVFVLIGSVGNVTTGALAEARGWVPAYGTVAVAVLLAAVLVSANALRGHVK